MDEVPRDATDPPLSGIQALSALEKALREALSSVPPEHVLHQVTVMFPKIPVEIDTGRLSRFHGRVQKVSVSMPEDLAAAVRERTGPGGFSRYVAESIEERLRLELMDQYAAELEAALGSLAPEELEEAMQEWPDYEG
jgi:hypothetical protein